MIWIVTKTVCKSQEELEHRHKYIQDVTGARVSPWCEFECKRLGVFPAKFGCYKCQSDKGEYGVIITAHINEVTTIINNIIGDKRAIVVANSCEWERGFSKKILDLVNTKNRNSELFFAKQQKDDNGHLVNYADDIGEFGFKTTLSERKLFRQRQSGLIKAIRIAYDKVVSNE